MNEEVEKLADDVATTILFYRAKLQAAEKVIDAARSMLAESDANRSGTISTVHLRNAMKEFDAATGGGKP